MLKETGKLRIILTVIFLIFTAASLSAQTVTLSAELQKDKIWLGETVRLTLYLQGSEEPVAPELSIPGVQVVPIGGTVNSSRSVTNINGKVTENITRAYVYGYLLTPLKDGQFLIPPVKVNVGGRDLSTEPLF